MNFSLLLTIVVAYSAAHTVQALTDQNPCDIALPLNSTLRGPENFVEDLEREGFLCDRLLRSKWYRFHDWDAASGTYKNTKMHEECTSDYTCGTHSPVYLNALYAGHPEEREGVVEREVCASLDGNCCARRWRIKIKNCGGFMAYRLPDVPGCYMAYCAV